jgi:hypothetical protein
MGAKLTVDPAGAATSLTLSSPLWDDGSDGGYSQERATWRSGTKVRTWAPVSVPPWSAAYVLRLTDAERASFVADIMRDFVGGDTLRVYPDSSDLLEYVDLLSVGSIVDISFSRMFPGRDDWFLCRFNTIELEA